MILCLSRQGTIKISPPQRPQATSIGLNVADLHTTKRLYNQWNILEYDDQHIQSIILTSLEWYTYLWVWIRVYYVLNVCNMFLWYMLRHSSFRLVVPINYFVGYNEIDICQNIFVTSVYHLLPSCRFKCCIIVSWISDVRGLIPRMYKRQEQHKLDVYYLVLFDTKWSSCVQVRYQQGLNFN